MPILFLISHWVWLLSPMCAWVWGHALEHGQPTRGCTHRENYPLFPTHWLPIASLPGVGDFMSLFPIHSETLAGWTLWSNHNSSWLWWPNHVQKKYSTALLSTQQRWHSPHPNPFWDISWALVACIEEEDVSIDVPGRTEHLIVSTFIWILFDLSSRNPKTISKWKTVL